MALISFSPLQDGVTGVNAAATNTPLSTIYNDYNGNITDANIASGAAIAGSKINMASIAIPYKFSVYQSANQSVGTANTLVTFNTKEFDTGSNYDASSTHVFTAPVSGFYSFSAFVGIAAAGSMTRAAIALYKNTSTEIKRGNDITGTNEVYGLGVSIPILQLSANDTIGIWIFTIGASSTVEGGQATAWFSGSLVCAT